VLDENVQIFNSLYQDYFKLKEMYPILKALVKFYKLQDNKYFSMILDKNLHSKEGLYKAY